MKILALDSSGMSASAAVAEDDILKAEFTVNTGKMHSQILLPLVAAVRDQTGMDLSDIDAIAVAEGPGSFTGLRIGSATAKGLGLVWDKPIVPVPTVDGLAYNLFGTDKMVCPLMDARRNQVYTGIYEFVSEDAEDQNTGAAGNVPGHIQMKIHQQQCVVYIEEILSKLIKLGRETVFLGDGVPVYENVIREKMTVPYTFAPAHMNRQRAGSIAVLGAELYRKNVIQTAAGHAPIYLRMSQAEQEAQEQKAKET